MKDLRTCIDAMCLDAHISTLKALEEFSWLLLLKAIEANECIYPDYSDHWDEDKHFTFYNELCWINWADEKSIGRFRNGGLVDFVNEKLIPYCRELPQDRGSLRNNPIAYNILKSVKQYLTTSESLENVLHYINGLHLTRLEPNYDLYGYDAFFAVSKLIPEISKILPDFGPSLNETVFRFIIDKVSIYSNQNVCFVGKNIGYDIYHIKEDWEDVDYEDFPWGISVYASECGSAENLLSCTLFCIGTLLFPIACFRRVGKDSVDQHDRIYVNPFNSIGEPLIPDDLIYNVNEESRDSDSYALSFAMNHLRQEGKAAVIVSNAFMKSLDPTHINLKKQLLMKYNFHSAVRLPKDRNNNISSTYILFFDNTAPTGYIDFFNLSTKEKWPFSHELYMLDNWWTERPDSIITAEGAWKARRISSKILSEDYAYDFSKWLDVDKDDPFREYPEEELESFTGYYVVHLEENDHYKKWGKVSADISKEDFYRIYREDPILSYHIDSGNIIYMDGRLYWSQDLERDTAGVFHLPATGTIQSGISKPYPFMFEQTYIRDKLWWPGEIDPDEEVIEPDENGVIHSTKYIYRVSRNALNEKNSYNCFISDIMMRAIGNKSFGESIKTLMSKDYCNVSGKELAINLGIDDSYISNMRNNKKYLDKKHVISVCLALHLPPRVTYSLLDRAGISLDPANSYVRGGIDLSYTTLIISYWCREYSEAYEYLKDGNQESLILAPPPGYLKESR